MKLNKNNWDTKPFIGIIITKLIIIIKDGNTSHTTWWWCAECVCVCDSQVAPLGAGLLCPLVIHGGSSLGLHAPSYRFTGHQKDHLGLSASYLASFIFLWHPSREKHIYHCGKYDILAENYDIYKINVVFSWLNDEIWQMEDDILLARYKASILQCVADEEWGRGTTRSSS